METQKTKFYGEYHVTDCEHDGDIRCAKEEVRRAGGHVETVYKERIDDDSRDMSYEAFSWYIIFYCSSREELRNVYRRLGVKE